MACTGRGGLVLWCWDWEAWLCSPCMGEDGSVWAGRRQRARASAASRHFWRSARQWLTFSFVGWGKHTLYGAWTLVWGSIALYPFDFRPTGRQPCKLHALNTASLCARQVVARPCDWLGFCLGHRAPRCTTIRKCTLHHHYCRSCLDLGGLDYFEHLAHTTLICALWLCFMIMSIAVNLI